MLHLKIYKYNVFIQDVSTVDGHCQLDTVNDIGFCETQ